MTKKHDYHQTNREFKGRSLLQIPKDYTVIDVETTAFNFFYGDIIEVGAVKVRDNKIVDQFSELIKLHYTLPPHITEKTGITNEMLQNARNPHNVICDFFDFLDNDLLIAHNANFDINFLYDLHSYLGIPPLNNDFVDTLRLSRKIHKELDNHKLDTLCELYKVERIEHRSLTDCLSTYEVYLNFYSLLEDNPNLIKTIENRRKNIDLTQLEASEIEIDETNFFYNKTICFTGRMDYLSKVEAAQLILNLGAVPANNLTKDTDILILGNLKYQHDTYGDKSNKHKKAEKLISEGAAIEILTESDFLEIIRQFSENFD